MRVEEILRAVMEEKGMTKADLGRAVGIADEKNPSDVIKNG